MGSFANYALRALGGGGPPVAGRLAYGHALPCSSINRMSDSASDIVLLF
jgi:hypothetical protein